MPHGNRQPSDDTGRGWLRGAPLSDAISAGLRAPILDDSAAPPASDYTWTDDADPHDTPGSRRYWIEQYHEQLEVMQALRSDLSRARFDRDIWWPLAFCVGVACGLGFQWFA